MRGNCLTWAIRKWRREGGMQGQGYVAFRTSRWVKRFRVFGHEFVVWFPHVLWTPTISPDCESLVPKNPKPRFIPPPIFDGEVRKGDAQE